MIDYVTTAAETRHLVARVEEHVVALRFVFPSLGRTKQGEAIYKRWG